MSKVTMFKGKEYDSRHGGPFDRGSADSYYDRGQAPHYYLGHTYDSPRIDEKDMTAQEIADYMAGYMYNEIYGDKKNYGTE